MSAGGVVNTLDWQIANAIQWLDADDHTHVADDMRDARKKVAALVEALKSAAHVLEWTGAEYASARARDALRAAGVATEGGLGETL